jgi:hypothetical protein
MEKKFVLILFILLILGSFASATDTQIIIHTIPGYKAMISFLNPGYSYSLIESFHYTANNDGDIKFVFSTNKDEFDVAIWLSKDGVAVTNKRFDETFNAGEKLELEIYPKWYTPPVNNITDVTDIPNITSDEVNEIISGEETNESNAEKETLGETSENPEKDRKVTALSIENGKVSISARIFYYVLGLIAIVIIIFLSIKEAKRGRFKKTSKPKEIKVTKLSEMNEAKKSSSNSVEEQEKRIAEAKKKIEEAETELRKMKNEDKIAEVKKRLIEDEKELMRLRSGK